eukprot:CAMPEP_0204614374 /NCGR_PEP_ID=MMETSP0717-20131115/2111_1 /ASSEMBLY_ACC=CAM_ASM_000666 /TAXON_ID=230516 /ORGANISM="Chaetoceros curvisetus" /LENGTH=45 /DNA_ID= /DNA_START= /DNA_END= /DNA_ORIENTATION=
MQTEDLFINTSYAGEAIEAIGEGLPQLDTEPSLALMIKSKDAVDG